MQSLFQKQQADVDFSDKYASFKVGDDYIFPHEKLPIALEKLELEIKTKTAERLKEQRAEQALKKVTNKDRFMHTFKMESSEEQGDLNFEVGLYSELGVTFKSNEDDIRNNYLAIAEKILKQTSTDHQIR